MHNKDTCRCKNYCRQAGNKILENSFFFLNELLPEDLKEELLCVPCSVMLKEHHNMAVFQSLKTVECCEAHSIYSSVAQTVCSVHA